MSVRQVFSSRMRKVGATALLALALAACESVEERVAGHYERGLELVAEDSEERAALEFRNALRLDREHAPSHFELGKISEARGNIGGAARSYRSAIEIDQTHHQARTRLGLVLIATGNLNDAAEFVAEAVAIAPQDPDALGAQATLQLRRGDIDAAMVSARTALEADPSHVAANAVLIAERIQAGDRQGALAIIDAQLINNPRELTYDLVRLRLMMAEGDLDAVDVQLSAMVEKYPEERQFARSLAQWRLNNGDEEGAKRAMADAIANDPEDIDTLRDYMAIVRRIDGDAAMYEELTHRAETAATPEISALLLRSRAEIDVRNGRVDVAEGTLNALIENGDTDEIVNDARVQLAAMKLAAADTPAAVAIVDAILDGDPENVGGLSLRAQIALADYRPADAIVDLRTALDNDPRNVQLMLLEAQAHERNGDLTIAGERLAAATRASAYEPEVALRYVRYLRNDGNLTAAETVLSEVARRHPTDVTTLAALTEARLALEDWVGADQAIAALRAVEGGAETAARADAAALAAQGRLDDSIRVLEGIATGGGGDSATAGLVSSYIRAGRLDEAIRLVEELIARDPRDAVAQLLRAELYLRENDLVSAEERLKMVVETLPDQASGYMALARFYLQTGRRDEAFAVLRDGAERATDSERIRFMQAQLYEAERDFDTAIAIYDELYEMNANSTVYANNLASLLAEHRADDQESMERARQVAQRLRGYDIPHFQDTYGWVMFLDGDLDAARSSLISAAEALSDNAVVRYHAGRLLAALGESEAARDHLTAALALDPDFPKANSARVTLEALP